MTSLMLREVRMATQFFWNEPFELSQRLEILTVDLRRMANRHRPLPSELSRAPTLDRWHFDVPHVPVAFGGVLDQYGTPFAAFRYVLSSP